MRILKYALLTLLVAIITDGVMVYAVSTSSVFGDFHLKGNVSQTGNYVGKEYYGQQKYVNLKTYTSLTNPCPNCHVTTTIIKSDGAASGGMTTATGDTTLFTNTAIYDVGNYKLKQVRVELTALTTYHYYQWYINNY